MYNFCTLFDSYYLSSGIALYESLKKYNANFHLYIYPFDKRCEKILRKMSLENATIIPQEEFENKRLLNVKKDRTIGEYCWTCTPSTIKYTIEKFDLDNCTYLDADLYFFCSYMPIFDELENGSVLITEHRYTSKYDVSEFSGKYCVQFMTFKNDEYGMKALNWWVDACIDWCYARYEDGKFGDQKYLDDWLTRFENVHSLEHIGGGVAPWNVQQYKIKKVKNSVKVKKDDFEFDLIFYHFQNLRFLDKETVELTEYKIDKDVVELIYKPYIRHIAEINKKLKEFENGFESKIYKKQKQSIKNNLRIIKKILQGRYNIYSLDKLLRE